MEIHEYQELRARYSPVEIPCEVCGSNWLEILQYRGRIRAAGEYGANPISICKKCGFTFQNPRFEDSFYKNYYKELYREVAFGSALPSEEYVNTQQLRGGNVLSYLQSYFTKPGEMLDHGCASGATMVPFRDFGWNAVGIDPHEPSVQMGVKHLGLDVRLAGGEELPLEDSSLDLIVSLGSLEHVYDFNRSMSEIRRTLREGGLLFIRWRSDKLWGSAYEYYNHNHYRFFTPTTWRLALASYGFLIEEITYQEIEGNTGAAYTIARKSRDAKEQVESLIDEGIVDSAESIKSKLNDYKRAYGKRCQQFLNFADSVGRNPLQVKAGVDSGLVNYRLLLGDPEWTVPRAILEAERYDTEFSQDPLVFSAAEENH